MTHRLRILHVDPERDWGGGQAQVFGLTRYLVEAGHVSHVATPKNGRLAARLRQDGLPVRELSIRNDLDGVAGWRLRRLVCLGGYDIVHFHTARAHALSPWLSKLAVKRIVTRRMDYPVKSGWWSRRLYKKHVDMVIAISSRIANALRSVDIPDASLRIIPSGVDTERFNPQNSRRAAVRARYGLQDADRLVLMAGSLVTRKSPRTLIEAAAQLRTRFLPHTTDGQSATLHYLLCGDGPLRTELETQVAMQGLGHRFHFVGFCQDPTEYFSAADVFVHVPVREGLGVAVIEALASGLPVVASRVGGIPDLITDRETGLLVPSQDPTALSAAILHYLQNPEWAKRLGARGQARIRAEYDIAATVRANEALYVELLAAAS